MDIAQLRSFLAVADSRSISTAAHVLGVNQPTLSKTIRRLEKELGVALFQRLPRGVVLTEYGSTLAHYVASMDSNLRSALRSIEALRSAQTARLVVGAGGTWLEDKLPLAVAAMTMRRPAARITIVNENPEALVERLLEGGLDLLFAPIRAADRNRDELVTETLMTGLQIVLGRRGHPLAGVADVPLRALARERWALPGGTYIRERFDSLFVSRGIDPPEPSVEVRDSPCLFEIVERSDLLTYVPSLRLDNRPGRLTQIRSTEATVERETGLITRRDRPMHPLAIELMSDVRAQLGAGATAPRPQR
ncbi:MAG: LysR family transcriptional regulator [Ectothiorhodospiraceae bacterium]|nr:LysR family transcriptional regulator [Ectothiorhodospiraceae bacterium]